MLLRIPGRELRPKRIIMEANSKQKTHKREYNMKTKSIGFWAIAALAASVLVAPTAYSQTERFSARLSGAEEVPPINTAGTGDFEMTMQQGTITFLLTFSDLSSPLSLAHLHFAPSRVAGGVMIFLCGGGASQLAERQLREASRGPSRRKMSPGPRARALPRAILIQPWRPCANVSPMRTCTQRTLVAVKFAAKSVEAWAMVEVIDFL